MRNRENNEIGRKLPAGQKKNFVDYVKCTGYILVYLPLDRRYRKYYNLTSSLICSVIAQRYAQK